MSKQVDFLCSDLTLEMTQENRELLLSHSLYFYFTLGIYDNKNVKININWTSTTKIILANKNTFEVF